MKLEQTRKSTGPGGDIWWYTDGFGHDDLKIVKVPASHNPSGGPAYYDAYGIGRSFRGFKTKAEALAWLVGAEMKPAPTLAVKKRFRVDYPYPSIAALVWGDNDLVATFEPGWSDFAEQLAFERNTELGEGPK